jgi:hypothetical protein
MNLCALIKNNYKLVWQLIFVHKACNKKLDTFTKVRLYIVHNLIHLSQSFLELKLIFDISIPHNIFSTPMNLKF